LESAEITTATHQKYAIERTRILGAFMTITGGEFAGCVPKIVASIGSTTLGLIPRRKSQRGFPAKRVAPDKLH
jgi:hypothetical protein